MNKAELVHEISVKAGLSKKDAEKALEAVTGTITNALKKGDKVQLVGFGTFEVRQRAAKQGHNPKTGAPMQIPASKLPAFKAGKAFKEAVAKK
jgi:DNA-binding protein HU-beta